jgi:hypothetical protein
MYALARLTPIEGVAASGLPADIAKHVLSLGRVEWGQTHAHDADGHGEHVARSVRLTAETFGQEGDQHMHGLWLAGTETVLCHTGTSPNAPKTTQALVGAWNWLVDQASTPPATSPAIPEGTSGDGVGVVAWLYELFDKREITFERCPNRISWAETALYASPIEAERLAYKTGYSEAYEDCTGTVDHNAAEEGWGQYIEARALTPDATQTREAELGPPDELGSAAFELLALGYAKATAWHKHGIAWDHCERISQDELIVEARAALNARGGA